MTAVEAILARALLVRDRAVPRDVVLPTGITSALPREARTPQTARTPPTSQTAQTPRTSAGAAAENLRALCETLVAHTPAVVVAGFVTEQVPEPRSALVLACVLQLTQAEDGARFWWQYAAGAGQATAAYCLYLHHLSLGEDEAARWWHRQTDDVQREPEDRPAADTGAAERITSASTTMILRVLHRLARQMPRPRSAAVMELMDFMPTAVATGYLRDPDMDLPMPGRDFAERIRMLLTPVEGEEHGFAPAPVMEVRGTHRCLGGTATR